MPDLIPCSACKAKVSTEAKSCPHCGQPVTLPKVEKTVYPKTYGDIPWYQRNWVLILAYLFFLPGAIMMLIVGPVYFKSDEGVKPYGTAARAVMIIFCFATLCTGLYYGINIARG